MSKLTSYTIVFLCLTTCVIAQNGENTGKFRLAFYNVENFFDIHVDSTLAYNDFTPEGNRRWTARRYNRKRDKLYKVITAMGEWDGLTLIGLAEIENAQILDDLVSNTPLAKDHYEFIHFDSHDSRRTDVALLYRPDRFKVVYASPVSLYDSCRSPINTRDILYVKGLLEKDTLHLFVNHWTSRYRGLLRSASLRMQAARHLSYLADSLCQLNPGALIVIMGDFNDNPEDESMQWISGQVGSCNLLNLPLLAAHKEVNGTVKYNGKWYFFDQILISKGLIEHDNLKARSTGEVFTAPFLLIKDEKYMGVKPKRNYLGFKYQDGFSDHLPVFIDIHVIH